MTETLTPTTATSTYPAGWTCSTCKMFVPNGCTHSCPTTYFGTGTAAPTPATKMDHGFAYAAALERVAAALESIAQAIAAASSARTKEEA